MPRSATPLSPPSRSPQAAAPLARLGQQIRREHLLTLRVPTTTPSAHPRPFQMQMNLGLPGEPHPAMHLQTVPGPPHGSLIGKQPSRSDVHHIPGNSRRVHGGPSHLHPHQRLRTQMLDGLKPPDRLPELLPSPGVLHRKPTHTPSGPKLLGGSEKNSNRFGTRGSRHPMQRRQRIDRPQRYGPLGPRQHDIGLVQPLHEAPVGSGDNRLSGSRARHHPSSKMRSHQRPRHQPPPKLLKHQHSFGKPKSSPSLSFSHPQREHPKVAKGPPQTPIQPRSF